MKILFSIVFVLIITSSAFAQGWTCDDYIIGNFNNSAYYNVADVIDGFAYLKVGVIPGREPVLCPCVQGHIPPEWPIMGDVNGDCFFNIADIVLSFMRLKLGLPLVHPCPECAPESYVGGACCIPYGPLAGCYNGMETHCIANGGIWYEGEDCETFQCPD